MSEPGPTPASVTRPTESLEDVGTPEERAEALARLRALPGWENLDREHHPAEFAWAERILGVDRAL